MKKISVCICGGGSLGHVTAGYFINKAQVNILTRHPESWNEEISTTDCEGNTFQGKLHKVSNNPEEVIPHCHLILLCLPGYAIKEQLKEIAPYIHEEQYIGSIVGSTGFFFFASDLLSKGTKLFAFQRVPFIARTNVYGKSSFLLGYKKLLKVATINIQDKTDLEQLLQNLFYTPIVFLSNFLEAALSNSNPLLHTVRLYCLFNDFAEKKTYSKHFLFYEDWDEKSSDLLIKCDKEFQHLVKTLSIDIPSILEHYESSDSASLTAKIKSIQAFHGLKAPMIKIADKSYVPDFNDRYFLEDFPYGLYILKQITDFCHVDTPYITTVLEWGYQVLGQDKFQPINIKELLLTKSIH